MDNDKLEKTIEGIEVIYKFFGFGLPTQNKAFEAYKAILTDALDILKTLKKREVDTPIKQSILQCNHCKHYAGVHDVPGNAPCDFWNIGCVLYNDFCSRFEREQKEKLEDAYHKGYCDGYNAKTMEIEEDMI